MFQSDREPPPVIHCVAYFNFEDCEDLGKAQLPWCITENCDNYPALKIRLNSLLLQLHITNPKSCIRSPSYQLLLLSIPVERQTQQIEPEN